MSPSVILASASPRRRDLLEQVGIAFEAGPVGVDETRLAGESPAEYVERLARDKALAGQASWPRRPGRERPVLGVDTAVVVDGDILGKPEDEAAGCAMLAHLSGREHEVHTGVAVALGERVESRVVCTRVLLGPTSADERAAYWASGEPADKAGAYAIQGLGAVFVERIDGSYSNVVGLPLYETVELLRRFGVDPLAAIVEGPAGR